MRGMDGLGFSLDDFRRQQFEASVARFADEWLLPVRCREHGSGVVETQATLDEPWMEFTYGCGCKLSSGPYHLMRERADHG